MPTPATKQASSTGQAKPEAPAKKAATPTAKAQPKSTSKPKTTRTTVFATTEFDKVLKAVKAAGGAGISLKLLSEKTGLRARVVHNVTWRMEGSPEIHDNAKTKLGVPRKPMERSIHRKSGTGRSVVYVNGR